ncbi:Vitamin B12 import ATP-binding protein BtuD [Streptomyces sp. enrichment culture]
MATLGLAGHRAARWPTLSQGQHDRTLIARALMPQPRLLLLDEPATGLDLPGREQLIGALEELGREHPRLATVLVTHHLEELPAHTTHALLLREGRPLAGGPVAEVLTADQLGTCFDLPLAWERHGPVECARGTPGVTRGPVRAGPGPFAHPRARRATTCSGRTRTRRSSASCRRRGRGS